MVMSLLNKKNDEFENYRNEARAFFEALFGDMPEDYLFQIWTLQNKKTGWYKEPETGANYIANRTSGEDVYFGIGITKMPQLKGRGKKENVHGIVGVHFDIDVADSDGHKKKNLPETYAGAAGLLDDFGLKPSAVIHSGGGIQAYYLFKEPWLFDSQEEREEAEAFIRRCHITLKECARKKGWTIDSVFDVTRVMRVPGTINTKYNPPRKAKTKYLDGPRYNPGDLEDYIIQEIPEEEKTLPIKEAVESTGGTVYDPAARAPAIKLDALLDLDDAFKSVWQKKMDHKLPSASEYDWSIISRVAQYDFTVQECIDTVIEWRTRHGENPEKIARADIRNRLAAKAHKVISEQEEQDATRGLETNAAATGTSYTQERDVVLSQISKKIGIKVTGLMKYLEEPPKFELHTAHGVVWLGTFDNISTQKRFRDIVGPNIGIYPKYVKGKKEDPGSGWDSMIQNFLNIAVDIEISDESTELGEFIAYIKNYLEGREKYDVDEMFVSDLPIWKDEQWHVSIDKLLRFITTAGNRAENRKSLGRKLKWIGARKVHVWASPDGKKTAKRMWAIPNDVFEESFPKTLTELYAIKN